MSKIVIERVEIEIPDEVEFKYDDAKEWLNTEFSGHGVYINNPLAQYELDDLKITYTNLQIEQ
jgi:CYTH domain-containing protein